MHLVHMSVYIELIQEPLVAITALEISPPVLVFVLLVLKVHIHRFMEGTSCRKVFSLHVEHGKDVVCEVSAHLSRYLSRARAICADETQNHMNQRRHYHCTDDLHPTASMTAVLCGSASSDTHPRMQLRGHRVTVIVNEISIKWRSNKNTVPLGLRIVIRLRIPVSVI
jgi:hypothetical protein